MSGLVAFFFCASTPYRLLRTEHMRASATLSDNTARQSWPSLVMNGHTQRNSASQPETSAILPSQAPYTRTHKAVSAGTRTFPISGRRPSHVKEPIAISAVPSETHARRSFKPLVRNTWHHSAQPATRSLSFCTEQCIQQQGPRISRPMLKIFYPNFPTRRIFFAACYKSVLPTPCSPG